MKQIQVWHQTNAFDELSRAIKLHPKYEEATWLVGRLDKHSAIFAGR